METFSKEGTPKTPAIKLDANSGVLEIVGRSNPENAREFYMPVIEWFDMYIQQPAARTDLKVNLEHFNTSTSKYLMEIFRKIRILADKDNEFNVTWYYEDDDLEMLDTAEAFEMMTGLRFQKISYPEGTQPH